MNIRKTIALRTSLLISPMGSDLLYIPQIRGLCMTSDMLRRRLPLSADSAKLDLGDSEIHVLAEDRAGWPLNGG